MVALGLSQFVMPLTHQVGHMLDIMLGEGITVDLNAVDAAPWLDHFALKAWLGTLNPPCLDGEQIYACLQSQMNPSRHQEILQEPVPPCDLGELLED